MPFPSGDRPWPNWALFKQDPDQSTAEDNPLIAKARPNTGAEANWIVLFAHGQSVSGSEQSSAAWDLWGQDVARWFGLGLAVDGPLSLACASIPAVLRFHVPLIEPDRRNFRISALGESLTPLPTENWRSAGRAGLGHKPPTNATDPLLRAGPGDRYLP
jgi:hypothetical protein